MPCRDSLRPRARLVLTPFQSFLNSRSKSIIGRQAVHVKALNHWRVSQLAPPAVHRAADMDSERASTPTPSACSPAQ